MLCDVKETTEKQNNTIKQRKKGRRVHGSGDGGRPLDPDSRRMPWRRKAMKKSNFIRGYVKFK